MVLQNTLKNFFVVLSIEKLETSLMFRSTCESAFFKNKLHVALKNYVNFAVDGKIILVTVRNRPKIKTTGFSSKTLFFDCAMKLQS